MLALLVDQERLGDPYLNLWLHEVQVMFKELTEDR